MNIVGYYTRYAIDRAADSIHRNSREAAAFLEAQDEKDFGKSSIGTSTGIRVATVYYTDPNSSCGNRNGREEVKPLGVTVDKIKNLQNLELQYAIAKKKEDLSKSSQSLGFFHAIGSFITPSLEIRSSEEIKGQFSEEMLVNIPQRSKEYLEGEYSIQDIGYLLKETTIQNERNRLYKKISKEGLDSAEQPINAAVKEAARNLMVTRVTNNGKAFSAALGLGTAALAWRYFSK